MQVAAGSELTRDSGVLLCTVFSRAFVFDVGKPVQPKVGMVR